MGSDQSTSQEFKENVEKTVNSASNTTNTTKSPEELKKEHIEEVEKFFGPDFPITIFPEVFHLRNEIIQIRQYFHANPELSHKEFNTSLNISQYLKRLGLEVIDKTYAKPTGVVGILKGDNPGPCILLRADMDALPIQETNDIKYRSKNDGVMHACGHDCHMAILLGTARLLSKFKHNLHGTIKFCFQPAEEGGGGAKEMIQDGVLENPNVDFVFGLHVWSYEKFGKIVIREGPLMAGADFFKIIIKGKGGHGAVPQGTIDAIVVATNLINQLHTIVSRNISPMDNAVLTIGSIHGGTKNNVIADLVELEGTIRYFNNKDENIIKTRMKEICDGVEKSFNCKIELNIDENLHCGPVINDETGVAYVRNAAQQVLPHTNIITGQPTLAAEDFSYFLEHRKGCFFFLSCGVDDDEKSNKVYPHHHQEFRVDERCLPIGTQIMCTLALDLLSPDKNKLSQTTKRSSLTESQSQSQSQSQSEPQQIESKSLLSQSSDTSKTEISQLPFNANNLKRKSLEGKNGPITEEN